MSSSLFPDITREAKIVSGKEAASTNLTAITSTNISFDLTQSDHNLENVANETTGRVYVKPAVNKSKATQQQLPILISNDKTRSTSYRRLASSSDFLNVKNSPLATRCVYDWKPMERLTTKVVQAKVKVFKPPRRIEMPARPSSPFKVLVDYETFDSHEHNSNRSLSMKRLKYLKDHTEWSIFPYASIEEREQYK
jgi:hypothetical protein